MKFSRVISDRPGIMLAVLRTCGDLDQHKDMRIVDYSSINAFL
jgi:hypothetical protein